MFSSEMESNFTLKLEKQTSSFQQMEGSGNFGLRPEPMV